jgi:hypothetical protein
MSIRPLAFALLLAASPAFAADVDGKWTTTLDTPNGPIQINYVFKAQGAKLSGSSIGPDGNPIQIENGKVDGSKISFSLTLDLGQGPATFNYTGQVAPGEIKLHSEFNGMPFDFTLTKAK